MEDMTIEDLIADVIANPTPRRVPCERPAPPVVPTRRGMRALLRGVVRRVRRLSRWHMVKS